MRVAEESADMQVRKWLRLQADRVGAWVCIALGAIALLVGWFGVTSTAYPAEQIPYVLSGGIGGIFLLGLGVMLWLSADLKDEWRKLDRIEEKMPKRERPPLSQASSSNGRRQRPLTAQGRTPR
jgi:hypothetical protein